VDGPIHQMTVEYDGLRQEFLESLGFQVLRVTNDEVMNQLDKVRETVIRHLT
jgi:very-short-patch-repair endonuclease